MGKKKRLMRMTALFFAFLFSFTLLSRASWQYGTAVVSVSTPENRVISHQVVSTGKVTENQELAVVTEPDQRVTAIYVKEGQQVKKGDLLFEIDLELLNEKILEQQQEMEKQWLQVQDSKSQKEVGAMQKADQQAQAAENYSLNTGSASVRLSRAKRELSEAKKKLKDFRKSGDSQSQDGGVEEALESAFLEKQEAYLQASQELTQLQWQIEKAVDDAKTHARRDGARAGLERKDTVHTGMGEAVGDGLLEDMSSEDAMSETSVRSGSNEGGNQPAISDVYGAMEAAGDGLLEDISGTGSTESIGGTDSTDSPQTYPSETESVWSGDDSWDEDVLLEDDSLKEDNSLPEGADQTGDSLIGEENPGAFEGNEEQNGGAWPSSEAEQEKIEREVRAAWQPRLDAARSKVDQAMQEKEAAQAALTAYQQERLEAANSRDAQTEQQLIEAVQAANDAYVDASLAANEAAVTSGRAVASAGIPDASNSSDRMNEITYQQMELQLEKLERLKAAEGKIHAPGEGTITKINVTTGEKTQDIPAVLMADLDKGFRFVTEITKEQEKYIGVGDLVTLTSGNKKNKLEEVAVASVRASENQEDVYDLTVELPAEKFVIGAAFTMEFERKSSPYACCVPLSALRLDEKNQTYVLVTDEYESVMGTELRARKVSVKVLEQNELYAALEEGSLTSQQQVITHSDKTVEEQSRVRIRT